MESSVSANPTSSEDFPGWRVLEDIGAGVGLPTERERYTKPGTPRQQLEHMGVKVCYIWVDERVDEIRGLSLICLIARELRSFWRCGVCVGAS